MESMVENLKNCGKKAKEFVEENWQILLIAAGVLTAVCVVAGILLRRKK